MTVQQRVKRGIELLDKMYPRWRDKVVLEQLDMQSNTNGLLEQLYGDWLKAMRGLGLVEADSVYSYGFDIVASTDEKQYRDWQQLTATWKKAIEGKTA